MFLLALRESPQPFKKPFQSQEDFSGQINSINDTKTPELAKSVIKTGNIFDCNVCRDVDEKQIFNRCNCTGLKTT